MGRPFIINDATIYYKLNCDFSIEPMAEDQEYYSDYDAFKEGWV